MEKANILIVDDELGPRESLRMILKPQYNIYIAEDGYRALEILKEKPIDLITLDLRMPGLSGIDVLKEIKQNNTDVQVIIITGYGTLGTITTASQYGVYDYISKPFNVADVNTIIQKSLEKRRYGIDIKKLLEEIGSVNGQSRMERVKKIFEKSEPFLKHMQDKGISPSDMQSRCTDIDYIKFIKIVADIMQDSTAKFVEHAERMQHYVSIVLSILPLAEQEKHAIEIAACFHDIGKMGMDAEYSEWNQSSDDNAYSEWKKHPEKGVDILSAAGFAPIILESILHHHERYDGKGFPAGLRGEDIPLGARIIRIANVYDDMLLARPFPEAYAKEAIAQEFAVYGNGELDPALLQLFLRALHTHGEKLQ